MGTHIQANKNGRNYSLDFLKFISSFFIVCIHFEFPGKAGDFIIALARFAVPVFFMISGYYAYDDDRERIINKIWRIARMYFSVVVLYFCFNIAVKLFAGQYREAVWYVSTYLRIRYIVPFVFFNESNTAMHLWFLGALIYSYVIQLITVKFNVKDGITYVLSGVLLLIHLVAGFLFCVYGTQLPAFLLKNYVLRNFLFMGFPLFSVGRLIRKNEELLLMKIKGIHIAIMIVSGIAEAFVICGVYRERDLYLGAVLLAFSFFVTALKTKDSFYGDRAVTLFKTNSCVYLIHVMIGEILSVTMLEKIRMFLYLKPFIIFAIALVISLYINALALKKRKL